MSDGLWVMGGLDMVAIVGVGVSGVGMTDGLSVMGKPKMGVPMGVGVLGVGVLMEVEEMVVIG